MIAIADIDDKDSLEAWLKALPEDRRTRVAVTLAFRAAARVAPLYWQWQSRKGDLSDILIWRLLIISGVAGKLPTPLIKAAATATIDASNATAGTTTNDIATNATTTITASSAITAAAVAANSATGTIAATTAAAATAATASMAAADVTATAAGATWEAVRRDAAALAENDPPLETPLWPDTAPTEIEKQWADARPRLAAAPGYAWWINWYDALLQGTPQNWQMLEKIALIPRKVWDQGAEPVATAIAQIEAEYRDKAAPQPLRPDTATRLDSTKAALSQNRLAIMAQLRSVEAIVRDEAERLRTKNDIDPAERDRQIALLAEIDTHAGSLGDLLATDEAPGDDAVEKADSLLELYWKLICEWPRKNADEMVDCTVRGVMVGICAGAGALMGQPWVGVAIGGMMFSGKKLADIAKVAKGAVSGGP